MPLTAEEKARIDYLVEASKFDQTIIVGSDIREMSMFIQKLEEENSKLRESVEVRAMIHASQRHHYDLCHRVYEAAVKAKIIYGIGACGNGGIPTFEAIVTKIEEACNEIHNTKSAEVS
jgi:hypothetical protein